MIRYLVISFLAFISLVSCSLPTTRGLVATTITKEEVKNPYFSNPSLDYIYKAKIDVYGRNFGGILILKKIKHNAHRVVFTTEFGNTLFDIQFEGDTFTKNYILPELDRKLILKTLKNDFKIMLEEKKTVLQQYNSGNIQLYKTIDTNGYNFYFFNKDILEVLVNTSEKKEKVNILFSEIEENLAKKIVITHNNIKLTIALEYLNK